MIVLGMDTATASTAVALRMSDGRTREARDDPPPGAHPGHATRLLAMARELLELEGLRWRDVERIAVGVGPGTFTGLRVGVASARGLAQSLSVELVGVSSLRALAQGALGGGRHDAPAGPPEAILAVIDARRGEVFAAAYGPGGEGGPQQLAAARALAPELLARVVAEAGPAAEGAPRAWLALGDGAVRFAEQVVEAGVPTLTPGSPLHLLSAVAVCELGAAAPAGEGFEAILPDYRRRPDAELALEASGTARGSQP